LEIVACKKIQQNPKINISPIFDVLLRTFIKDIFKLLDEN